jgi:hypothetical protein
MTKNEIIEKTLNEIRPFDSNYEGTIIAELQRRLPDTDIKTCDDFKHLNIAGCEECHTSYAHYEMKLIDLPDGTKAWVCDPVEWAIYPERREQLRDLLRNSAEGGLLSHIFGHGDPDSEQR